MTAKVFKLNTANTTNLTKLADIGGVLYGIGGVNTAAYAIFVKFYWFLPTAAVPTPIVGTTVPDLTLEVPALGTATGQANQPMPTNGVTKTGQLFMAVTKLATDADATVVVAGDGLISVFYEG